MTKEIGFYIDLAGSKYHGAITYFVQKTIQMAAYKITLQQLYTRVNFLVDDAGYPHHPQLEGNTDNKTRLIFSR